MPPGEAPLDPICEETRDALLESRLAELPPRLAGHLAACPACWTESQALALLATLLPVEPDRDPPRGFASSVIGAVHADAAHARRRTRLASLVGLAAAALVSLGLTAFGAATPRSWAPEVPGGSLDPAAGARTLARELADGASGLLEPLGRLDASLRDLPASLDRLPAPPGAGPLAFAGAAGLALAQLAAWRGRARSRSDRARSGGLA